jgi:hypothetical protein
LATDLGEPAWEPPWAAALAGERLDIRFLFLQCRYLKLHDQTPKSYSNHPTRPLSQMNFTTFG